MGLTKSEKIELHKRRKLVAEAIRHPGTKIIMRELRRASKEMLFEYDNTADPERLARIRSARWFINSELPRIIEGIMNLEDENGGWSFVNFLRGIGLVKK